MLYLRNGRADWHGTKGMWVDRKLHPLCDFDLSPQPWHWPWIFKVKFWKSHISGMGWPIDMGWKGCESIECWTHVVAFNFPLTHDLDLGFSRSNFQGKIWKLLLLNNGRFDSLGMKGMWVGYDVGCTMGLTCGHGAWQIDRQSNGSMWNSYSFQPVGQWMSYPFTDLGAEGCCRSLNALFIYWYGQHVA